MDACRAAGPNPIFDFGLYCTSGLHFISIFRQLAFISVFADFLAGGHKICKINSCVSNLGGDRLAAMNSVFRTIDLTCLVIAPLVAGLIFDWASTSIAALAVAGISTE